MENCLRHELNREANMTILRRDLLAGTALVFAASVSGCKGKQAPLRTKFMDDFTAAFIGDPTKIKTPAPPPQVDS